MLARFFIDRPVLAWVISIVIVLIGGIASVLLPVAQYPDVTPPTVRVTAAYPGAANATARARLQAFFAAGGGYIGAGTNGANFLTGGSLVTGLTAASRTGNGRSGIVQWNNLGWTGSPIVGSFPAQDTAIMDPPTWFTATPATMSVDGRLPLVGYFLAGLWQPDAQSASAPGSRARPPSASRAPSTSRPSTRAPRSARPRSSTAASPATTTSPARTRPSR